MYFIFIMRLNMKKLSIEEKFISALGKLFQSILVEIDLALVCKSLTLRTSKLCI